MVNKVCWDSDKRTRILFLISLEFPLKFSDSGFIGL